MNGPTRPATSGLSALLVGLGGMGRVWLDALTGPAAERLGVRLVGLCDVDTDAARALLAGRGLALPVGASVADMLAEPPDLVIDCTPPNARAAIVGAALGSGAHVLCEKPLAPDAETAAHLVGLSTRSRGRLAVSQNRRFQPGVRALRDLVAAGSLGAATTLHCDLHMAPRFGGFREAMRHVMLRDMAIHAFDAARMVLGQDAVSVICVERTPPGPFVHGSEVQALFEMSRGALFRFSGSWVEAGPPSSWNGAWRLSLERGAARWDGEGRPRFFGLAAADAPAFLPDAVALEVGSPDDGGETDILGSLASFLGAIRSGTVPETNARDNANSLAMVFAAIRSAEALGRSERVERLSLRSDTSRHVRPLARDAG